MMFLYLLVDLIMMGLTLMIVHQKVKKPRHAWIIIAIVLFVLTTVFDNIIISLGIVAYNNHKLLGVFIGRAPIEDYGYPLLAAVLIPMLWLTFNPDKKSGK